MLHQMTFRSYAFRSCRIPNNSSKTILGPKRVIPESTHGTLAYTRVSILFRCIECTSSDGEHRLTRDSYQLEQRSVWRSPARDRCDTIKQLSQYIGPRSHFHKTVVSRGAALVREIYMAPLLTSARYLPMRW